MEPHPSPTNDEVLRLGEVVAERRREERMLHERVVLDAARQHDHARALPLRRCQRGERSTERRLERRQASDATRAERLGQQP
jgi:hypothetical protein